MTTCFETRSTREIESGLSKSTNEMWLRYLPDVSRCLVEKYTLTKSAHTSACGDWANSTQPFGSAWSVGSKIFPSFFHFMEHPPDA